MNNCNQVLLEGVFHESSQLRYTPAGTPIIEATVMHLSEQLEAGIARRVECEVRIVALGKTALALGQIGAGQKISVRGFLAAKNQRRRSELVLHIEEFELLN